MSFTAAISVKLMVVMQRMSGIHINGTALPQVLSGGAAAKQPSFANIAARNFTWIVISFGKAPK